MAKETLPAVNGTVEPGFERVREVFARNFARDDAYAEVGAAVAVYRKGRCVVDLWGGHADGARTRPWSRDTLVNVWSCTKGVTAACLALLVDEQRLRYEDLVRTHWPDFADAGKGGTTVEQLLSHQAGLQGFAEPTSLGDLYDWQTCCERLARQAPVWPPGMQTSYHAMTWGYLAGELLRRIMGESPGAFLARRLAGPLRADVFVGLPESEESRVAEQLPPLSRPSMGDRRPPPEAMMALVNPQVPPTAPNDRAWRAAQIPAANGQASAQGLARVYAMIANGGELDGARYLSKTTIARMSAVPALREDLLIGLRDNWAMGFSRNAMGMLGPEPDAFGHSGWGGSFGCAHLASGLSIGYVCNRMGADLVGDPRGRALCDAIFACVR
ncbi:MAG TPA: serine hydrolase domain-containing protein [Nevskiaceae bacterium]|nr:serine hydrolase domain-containing protein [Nevskiaceae bacterium]